MTTTKRTRRSKRMATVWSIEGRCIAHGTVADSSTGTCYECSVGTPAKATTTVDVRACGERTCKAADGFGPCLKKPGHDGWHSAEVA